MSLLRRPESKNLNECAKLIYMSGSKLYTYIFVDKVPMMFPRMRLYEDAGDLPASPNLHPITSDGIIAELQSGYNIVSLTGHGSWLQISMVNADDIKTLTNGFASGIVYAEGCSTGDFDHYNYNIPDCLGEEFVKNWQGGAAAYIGNTRFSWIGSGSDVERKVWSGLPSEVHIGRLHKRKSMCLDHTGHIWTQYSLNLLGDPEMNLWIGQLQPMCPIIPLTI